MNFTDRKKVAREMVLAFLNRFTPPRGLNEDGQVSLVAAISDAFARKMPVLSQEEFRDRIGDVLTKVADQHTSYAWPTQGAFVDAMPSGYGGGRRAPETFDAPSSAFARSINSGEAVPEFVIWGSQGSALVSSGEVSQTQIDAYRKSSVWSHRDVYGEEGPRTLLRRYGPVVNGYASFSEAAS